MFVLLKNVKTFYPDVDISGSGVNPYLVLFALGMLSADVCFSAGGAYKKISQVPWGWLAIVTFILFSAVKVITKRLDAASPILTENVLDVLFGILAFCVLNTCGAYKNGTKTVPLPAKILSWRPLVFVGTFSYTLYLFHAPLIQFIYQYMLLPLHVGTFNTVCLLATGGTAVIVGLSYVFYLCCERPFLRLLKNKRMPDATYEAVESPAP
jgi:peptidoglycan/LPS O-acetylase OafA/YrhL